MSKLFTSAEYSALFFTNPTTSASTNITGVSVASNVVTVQSTAHGLNPNDFAMILAVGGAVELNNALWRVASVPNANSVTLAGITAVTAYTSGGTIRKVATGDRVKDLLPYQIDGLREGLKRVPYDRSNESNYGSNEAAISTILS